VDRIQRLFVFFFSVLFCVFFLFFFFHARELRDVARYATTLWTVLREDAVIEQMKQRGLA